MTDSVQKTKILQSSLFKKVFTETYNPTFAEKWEPLVRILRFVGQCPVEIEKSYVRTNNGKLLHRVCYTFSCRSRFFVWALVLGAMRIFCWILHQGLLARGGNDQRDNFEKIISTVHLYAFPFVNIAEWAAVIYAGPLFCKVLNSWANFEETFDGILKTEKIPNNVAIDFKPVWTIFVLALFPAVLLNITRLILGFTNIIAIREPLVTEIFFTLCLLVITLIEETKIVVMFETIIISFRKVRQALKVFIEGPTQNSELKSNADANKMRKWFKTLQIIRDQVKLTAGCQAIHQILFYTYMSIVLCLFLFMGISSGLGGKETTVIIESFYKLGVLAFLILRVYIKTSKAREITGEEQEIIRVLEEWDLSAAGMHVKFEVKNIIDCLSRKPSVINYGGLITLDRRLLLSLGNIIVTNLIVLLQFQNSRC